MIKSTFRKIFVFCFLMLLVITMSFGTVGCGQNSTKKSIVCTTFAPYDFIREILGENVNNYDMKFLTDGGVDLHSYQPTVSDVVKVKTCDLFVYVGGESDEWVEDVLKDKQNSNMKVVRLMDVVENKCADHEHHDDHDGHDHHADEHVWLSVRNAKTITNYLASTLGEMDTKNAESYLANAQTYGQNLDAIDNDFALAVENSIFKTLVFGDRFPFLYFTLDYGLNYHAAFSGCSAESEASFQTIAALASVADEIGVNHICILENSDGKIAGQVIQQTSRKNLGTVVFNSCQSVTKEMANDGQSYLRIMRENLTSLKTALGQR